MQRINRFIFTIIMVLIMSFFLSACTNSDPLLKDRFHTDEYLPDYDQQLNYANSYGLLTKSGTMYYARLNYLIYYYDDATGMSGPLCFKAECEHADADCNAYIGQSTGKIHIYDEKIYWSDGTKLYRANLDGTEQKTVQKNIKNFTDKINPFMTLHRGYLYTAKIQQEVQDMQAKNIFTIDQYVLGKRWGKANPVFSKEYTGSLKYGYVFRANTMYFWTENYDGQQRYTREIYSYDVATNTVELLWSGDIGNWYSLNFLLRDDGIDFLDYHLGEGYAIRTSHFSFDSKELQIPEATPLEDGFMGGGLVDGYTLMLPGAQFKIQNSPYKIFDEDGNVYREGVMEGLCPTCLGSDDTGIFFYQAHPVNGFMTYRIVRIPWDTTQDPQILMEYTQYPRKDS